jgi:hypothetical protein
LKTNAAIAVGVVLATFTLAPDVAAAPPTKAECASAYEQGQRSKRLGRFRTARAQLLVCARDPCPKVLQDECLPWLQEIEKLTPSVVFSAISPEGSDTTSVRVAIDGETTLDHLDGKSVDVDPGVHTFRFESASGAVVEERLLVREGEKSRAVSARFAAPEAPSAVAPTRSPPETPLRAPVPGIAYAFGAIGLGSLGAFSYFGLRGIAAQDQLDQCRPACSPAEIRATRQDYIVADVFLGVSTFALGAALYVILTRPSLAPLAAIRPRARVSFSPGPQLTLGTSF